MPKEPKRPKPIEIELPHHAYQPSRAELREEFNMPAASLQTVRKAFFRPVTIQRK